MGLSSLATDAAILATPVVIAAQPVIGAWATSISASPRTRLPPTTSPAPARGRGGCRKCDGRVLVAYAVRWSRSRLVSVRPDPPMERGRGTPPRGTPTRPVGSPIPGEFSRNHHALSSAGQAVARTRLRRLSAVHQDALDVPRRSPPGRATQSDRELRLQLLIATSGLLLLPQSDSEPS
jgi:hypothetical protein